MIEKVAGGEYQIDNGGCPMMPDIPGDSRWCIPVYDENDRNNPRKANDKRSREI